MPKYHEDKTPEEEGFQNFTKHFKFIKNINSGAFGKVVLAEDLKDGKEYAVKVIPSPNFS